VSDVIGMVVNLALLSDRTKALANLTSPEFNQCT